MLPGEFVMKRPIKVSPITEEWGMKPNTIAVNASDAFKQTVFVTVQINGLRVARWRTWLAGKVLAVANWIAPFEIKQS